GRMASTVNAAQIDRSRFAPDAVIVASGEVTVDPVPNSHVPCLWLLTLGARASPVPQSGKEARRPEWRVSGPRQRFTGWLDDRRSTPPSRFVTSLTHLPRALR